MRRNSYVRVTCFARPGKITQPLPRCAKLGRVTAVLEGRLLDDVRCREGIRLNADYRNGAPIREDFLITSPVVRVEDGYALTDTSIVQILRIPPPPTVNTPPTGNGSLGKEGSTSQSARYLTASQRAALAELIAMAELTGDDGVYGGVHLRVRPLISGFSGSGKTTVVSHLCDHLATHNGAPCHLLRIPAGSWNVYGARQDPNTLVAVRDFVRSIGSGNSEIPDAAPAGAKAVILLDEIDKLTGRRGMVDGWYRSVTNEVIALADGDSRLLACGWSSADIAGLKSIMVIAAGAFLDGVEHAYQDKDSHLAVIASHCSIPEEVRLRFNSKIIYVEPPTAQDFREAFRRLYHDLGLALPPPGKLDDLIASAQEAKAGMRFVEEHVADLLIAHPHLRRVNPVHKRKLTVSAAEAGKKPEKPVITRSRYERVADQLFQLMGDLEAPLAHVQVLFQLHASQFARVRGDIINPLTNVASTAANLDNDFTLLLDGMRYNLCADDKQRDKRIEDLWLAGHRVLLAVRGATVLEPAFLQEKCLLALFTEVYAQLSRVLQLVKYITSVRAEGTE